MDVMATSLMIMLQLMKKEYSLSKVQLRIYIFNRLHKSHLLYQLRAWRCLHGWASLTSTIKPKGHHQLRPKFKAFMVYLQTWNQTQNHRKALLSATNGSLKSSCT
jgi:hypothetical protein